MGPIIEGLIRTFWTAVVAGTGLTGVDWEGGICTVNLWLVTDTGGATLFGTDTVCEVAAVVINRPC